MRTCRRRSVVGGGRRAGSPCLAVVLAVLAASVGAPSVAVARRGPWVDAHGYEHLFFRPADEAGPVADSWSETVVLDAEETIERHLRFEVVLPSALADGEGIPVAVVDGALGEDCEADDGETTLVLQPYGFAHLGRPLLCMWIPPPGSRAEGAVIDAHVTVHRPRLKRLGHRFAMLLPIQPPGMRAASLEFAVEHGVGQTPSILPHAWEVELNVKDLGGGRYRTFFRLDRVERLPVPPGAGTVAGRVPAMAITSGESWDQVALDHRAFFDAAARARDEAIPAAGRVLAQADVIASVREAVRLSLDEMGLDPSGGCGGTWLLPRRAAETVVAGSGTAADRAALLVALLRAADIRAEVVLASRSFIRVAPAEPLALLNQTIVLLPDVRLEEAGAPLFIDPSRGSDWLGALDEQLIGRDALMLGPQGARWLRLPSRPPRRSWTLNATETSDGVFDVQVAGVLDGAAAARVREWQAAGRPQDVAPVSDLAWLADPGWGGLDLAVAEEAGGRVAVTASGRISADDVLPEGRLPAPRLPEVALPDTSGSSWPFARDTLPLDADLLESWTFRSRSSGGAPAEGRRVTPFWEVDSLGSWSGPLFNRRTRLRFDSAALAPAAAVEVERFAEFSRRVLGGVTAPQRPQLQRHEPSDLGARSL